MQGVVVLISFRSYRFDTVDGHTALQQSTSFTLDGHIDSTPIQLPLRPYPFIHSPLLLAVWVVRAAVAWGRASSSLLKIHGALPVKSHFTQLQRWARNKSRYVLTYAEQNMYFLVAFRCYRHQKGVASTVQFGGLRIYLCFASTTRHHLCSPPMAQAVFHLV